MLSRTIGKADSVPEGIKTIEGRNAVLRVGGWPKAGCPRSFPTLPQRTREGWGNHHFLTFGWATRFCHVESSQSDDSGWEVGIFRLRRLAHFVRWSASLKMTGLQSRVGGSGPTRPLDRQTRRTQGWGTLNRGDLIKEKGGPPTSGPAFEQREGGGSQLRGDICGERSLRQPSSAKLPHSSQHRA